MIKILYEDRKIIEEMYNSQMPVNRIYSGSVVKTQI